MTIARFPTSSFITSTGGGAAVFFVLVFPIMMSLGGAAVDFSRAYAVRSEFTRSAEGAALAAASLTNARDPSEVVAEYLALNLSSAAREASYTITTNARKTAFASEVDVSIEGSVPVSFLSLVGVESLSFAVSASAAESRQNVEVSMVLDISSSMRGQKLRNLQDAADSFVRELLLRDSGRETSISLVPFGGSVNIGPALFTEYARIGGPAIWNPGPSQYHVEADVLTSGFRFSNGGFCLEAPYEEFADDRPPTPLSSGQPPDLWVWNAGNPWCPPAESAALFNSTSVDALTQRINEFVLSDGTGMDIGALWGYRALSPRWRGLLGGDFLSRPGVFDTDTIKVMVLMTDGNITAQFRPIDPANTHARHANQQTIVPRGRAGDAAGSLSAVGNFRRVCANAKADGVIVYTIGFRIQPGGLADTLLYDCASTPSRYYFVEDLDIAAAFESIAASISALRVTG